MRSMARKILAVASIGLPMLAQPASAQTVSVTWNNFSTLNPAGGESMTLNIVSDGNFSESDGYVGGLGFSSMTPVPLGDPITGGINLLWCTDIPENFYPGNTYTYSLNPLAGTANNGAQYATNPPTAAQANEITTLLYNAEANGAYGNELGKLSGSTQAIWSAATQLAIWAVLYDTSGSYSLINGNFNVPNDFGDAATAVSDGQTLINCVVLGSSCSSLPGWAASVPSGYSTYQLLDPGVQGQGYLSYNPPIAFNSS